MILFSLILHHNMGIKCADEPFNMGIFFFTKGVLHNGFIFRPPHTHPGICIQESLRDVYALLLAVQGCI